MEENPIFADSNELYKACKEYFQWTVDNPLYEEKVFHNGGKVTIHQSPKMRAMTIQGLCRYLDIGFQTWADYRIRKDFSEVCKHVEMVIYEQKFTGAAANLLSPSIIVRELGLKDKQQIDSNTQRLKEPKEMTLKELEAVLQQVSKDVTDELTAGGNPIEYDHLSDEELRAIIRAGRSQDELTERDIQEQIDELMELKEVAKKKGKVKI